MSIVEISVSRFSSDRVLDSELSEAFTVETESVLETSVAAELLGSEEDFSAKFVDCCCIELPLSL